MSGCFNITQLLLAGQLCAPPQCQGQVRAQGHGTYHSNGLPHGHVGGALGLSRCESITDEALKALASGCGGLTSVDLSYCRRITDEALKALASGCGGLTSVVNLSDCISHLLCF